MKIHLKVKLFREWLIDWLIDQLYPVSPSLSLASPDKSTVMLFPIYFTPWLIDWLIDWLIVLYPVVPSLSLHLIEHCDAVSNLLQAFIDMLKDSRDEGRNSVL